MTVPEAIELLRVVYTTNSSPLQERELDKFRIKVRNLLDKELDLPLCSTSEEATDARAREIMHRLIRAEKDAAHQGPVSIENV